MLISHSSKNMLTNWDSVFLRLVRKKPESPNFKPRSVAMWLPSSEASIRKSLHCYYHKSSSLENWNHVAVYMIYIVLVAKLQHRSPLKCRHRETRYTLHRKSLVVQTYIKKRLLFVRYRWTATILPSISVVQKIYQKSY